MQRTAIIAVCVIVSMAVAAYSEAESTKMFHEFMVQYKKNYGSQAEYLNRLAIFKSNLDLIDQLNARQTTARFGATKFADLSPEEFKATYLNYKKNPTPTESYATIELDTSGALPTSWDWTTKGAVTPVYDQGQCGSCWAFSATEAIESQWFLAGNKLTSLAPQQIVDCDQGNGDEGCNGGDTPTAYEYVIKAGGMETMADYPYTGEDGNCVFEKSEVVAHISNWTYATTSKNETQMQYALVAKGPLSICVDAESWQFYFGGVITMWCGNNLDHCVLITGYENYDAWDGETPIWMIRNSWGADWGENGYIYVERGYDLCGVGDEVTIPIV